LKANFFKKTALKNDLAYCNAGVAAVHSKVVGLAPGHSVGLPEVVSNFGPVSQHDDAARCQSEEVLDAVFALQSNSHLFNYKKNWVRINKACSNL
jgi:hypothetical protein